MDENRLEDLATRVKPRTASSLLLWGLVAFLLIFVVWAAFAELERTVRAPGRVIPNAQLQVVSNAEGGVVESILVQPGQRVAAGQVILQLDPTQTSADFGSGEASVSALGLKANRLQAEIAGREPAFPVPGNAAMAGQIGVEQALHRSRMAELAATRSAADARVRQAQFAVGEAEAAYQARVAARDARLSEARVLRSLVDKGIEPRLSLVQAESAAAVAASEAAAAAAAISRARSAVGEARASASQLTQEWRAVAANELAATQAELAVRRSGIPALAERAERTAVRAPLAGRVNRVLVTTVGSSVPPGAPLAEIVPGEQNLLVEARVRPQDIAFVRMGQRARVEVTAYDPAVYGRLDAAVIAISPDSVIDEQTGELFYTVRVRTALNALRDPAGRRLPIGPGMVANVSLLGDRRTVLQYLLNPITKLSDSALRE